VGTTWSCSPVILDPAGEGFHLTGVEDGVYFDIAAMGRATKTSWTENTSSNAWLVLDRNCNGYIDDAKELFGSSTPQPASDTPNGFLALAVFDQPDHGGNGDGFIDSHDDIWTKLRLWVDKNHNGLSEPEELYTLEQLGIGKIDLLYQESRKTDENGNLFRYRARIWTTKGERGNRWAYDVFLKGQFAPE
jgi:hypothetical protein